MKTLNEVTPNKKSPPDSRIQERNGDSELARKARIALLSDYRTHKSTSTRLTVIRMNELGKASGIQFALFGGRFRLAKVKLVNPSQKCKVDTRGSD